MTGQKKINETLLIVMLGILAFIGPFTIDMYLPGFANIAQDFDTEENRVAFTLTSYFIGIALGQLVYGPLVDKYGRKKPLLFGLMIFFVASILCAVSFSIEMMIAARFFQALGSSAGMVASTSIITDVYEPDKRARAFSLIMLVMGIAPVIAPALGSYFIEYFTWKTIFYFLAGFSILVMLLLYFFLPETAKYMHNDKLKIKNISADYRDIFKNRTFFLYTLGGSIINSMLFAYIASAAYIFLTFYGLSKSTFSILFGINAIGIISGSYINGHLTKRIHYIKILRIAVVSLIFITAIFAVLVYLNPNIPFQWVVVGIFLTLFGIGFTYPNAVAASLAPFTAKSGAASALGGSFRMAVSALVTALIGLFAATSAFTMFGLMAVLSLIASVFLLSAKRWATAKEKLNK